MQRLLSAESPKGAARGLVLSGFIVFAQFTLFLLIGAMLYAYHQHFPLTAALPRNDAILPRFIVDHLPHGLIGFIIAAIVAAALSPSINAMAATTVNDFYLKYVKTPPDEATLLRLSKRITIFWGIVQLVRRAGRAVAGSVGARRRAVGAVADDRSGARRVPGRRADAARRGGGDDWRAWPLGALVLCYVLVRRAWSGGRGTR